MFPAPQGAEFLSFPPHPAQALADQGIVVQGPFYEPDGLRADSSIIVTTAAQGVTFIPKYHGRVMVEVLGELVDGAMVTAKFRPLPNSPVFPLDLEETKKVLNLEGDMVLGCALGHSDLEIKIPSKNKSVLPRHLGVLGTTGGGKSTTISGLVRQFQKAGLATILIDTEGEYTHIDQPTDKQNMLNALDRRGLAPGGVENLKILHLVGRETTNPGFDKKQVFTLQFDQLSHHAVMEILDFTEPQVQRYTKAWDIAREILRELKIFPLTKEEQESLYDFDEFERGYPKTALALMYDIVSACGKQAELPANEKLTDAGEDLQFPNYWLRNQGKEQKKKFLEIIGKYKTKGDSVPSWRTIQGHLGQLLRLKIFDNNDAEPFNFKELTTPGQVFLIDLSDTDSPKIRNLVIAELLKGLMEQQNENHATTATDEQKQRKVMVIIEEAHEFLSTQRVKQMPTLYDQVARIAKRGRKRWLGLTFVTQLPQHLPNEVLALINNYILHKISDAGVISRLRSSIGGVDESMWDKLTSLSSGQAVVALSHMRRAMLTAIDPTPCKLLMSD